MRQVKPATLYINPALESRLADLRAAGVPLRPTPATALADLARLGMAAHGVLPPEVERALDASTAANVAVALDTLHQLAEQRGTLLAQLREVEDQQQAIFRQLRGAATALAADCTALAQAGKIFCAQARAKPPEAPRG